MSYYISSLTTCFTEEYTPLQSLVAYQRVHPQSLVAYQRAHTAVSDCLPKSTSAESLLAYQRVHPAESLLDYQRVHPPVTPCLPKSTPCRATPCLPKSTTTCHSFLTKEYILQSHFLLTKEYIILSHLAYQRVVLKCRSFSISLLEVLLPLNSSLKVLLFRKNLNCHSFPKRGRRGGGRGWL